MRMMVVFEKGAELRYIGHLDLMRAVQRALRRSRLPIKFSNGFNPHVRLSFAVPLSVGVIGERELMEVPVEDGVGEAQFCEKMNAVLPACLRIVSCRAVEDSFPALMSLVAGADYRIAFSCPDNQQKIADAFASFMALSECVALRKTKSGENPCDIRQFVLGGDCSFEGGVCTIRLHTIANASGMLKPSLWFDSFCEYAGLNAPDAMLYRTAILAKNADGSLVPMEDYNA